MMLQEEIDKCSNVCLTDGSVNFDINSINSKQVLDILEPFTESTKCHIYFEEEDRINIDSYNITNIKVKYDEDYSYNTFTEYNMDSDAISSINEYEVVKQCLSEQKDCSYIESYSYSLYLEISLKETA